MLATVMDGMVQTAVVGLGATAAMAVVGAGADHMHRRPPEEPSPCAKKGMSSTSTAVAARAGTRSVLAGERSSPLT